MEKNEIVYKSNRLIEARGRLSLQEQRLIAILCSRITKQDTDFEKYVFNYRELANQLDVDVKSYGRELELVIDRLQTKLMTIHEGEERVKVAWLAGSRYHDKKGLVSLSFHPDLKPYLLQLKDCFTKYDLNTVLLLKSKYAFKLFEILKRNENLGIREYSIDELKSLLMIEDGEYTSFGHLKKRVLEPAIKEINEKTELIIEHKYVKTVRAVTGIKFTIKQKAQVPEIKKQPEPVDQTGIEDLINLIPDSTRRLKSTRTLLNKALKKYDFDYIKETILYTNTREIKKDYLALLGTNLTNNYAEAWIEKKKLREDSSKRRISDEAQKRENDITELIEILKDEKQEILEKIAANRVKMKMRAEAAAIILAERDAAQSKIEWS